MMNIIETQFKQRQFDGKWEKIAKVMDHDNKYVYKTESGQRVSYTPEKWVTVGVYDLIGELE
jgi:hypothetical protein